VYGELGLETIQREDRSMYQLKGMESFQKAVELENLGMLRYQYALSLVEMGEFDLAMVQVQTAIGLDPAQPMFYNLLALMLDSREQVVKAIEVCKSGWKCCIEHVLQTQVSKNNKVKKQMEFKDIERMINWDVVDPNFKDELFK
jgi:predicted Zn-dependent protease